MVEQPIRNRQVIGSSPIVGSIRFRDLQIFNLKTGEHLGSIEKNQHHRPAQRYVNEHPIGTRMKAQAACQSRVWIHSVGIINSIRNVDTQRRTDWEEMGTGCIGLWGGRHFILTAGHVIHDKAKPSDIRIFWRPHGDDEYLADSQLRPEDIVNGIPVKDQNAGIHRCQWEDLAIITIDPSEIRPHSEPINISNDWADPQPDEIVHVFGYPSDTHLIVGDQLVSATRREVLAAIRPNTFSGQVMPGPNFLTNDFDSDRHYLVPYEHPTSQNPKGFSGAAAWWEPPDPQQVWRPNFKFAGMCTHAYKNGTVERIVKASTVRRFLEAELGAADS